MSGRAALAASVVAVLALALAPGPLRRLAGGDGDGAEPRLDVALQIGQLRRNAAVVADGDTYGIDPAVAATQPPLVQGNLKAVGQLYLARGLPLHDPSRARYVLTVEGTLVRLGGRR